ncbi:MAG TPA: hypothetical protein VMV33_17165 [Rhodocyclaceae bacterium]|nr:hypothetical protein [Rhodocyclaceae bacterium]
MALQHILRVDMVNGLHLEFAFRSREAGQANQDKVRSVMADVRENPDKIGEGALVMIEDEQGRAGLVDGAVVQAVALVDLAREVEGTVEQQALIEATKAKAVAKEQARHRLEASVAARPGIVVPRRGMLPVDGFDRV